MEDFNDACLGIWFATVFEATFMDWPDKEMLFALPREEPVEDTVLEEEDRPVEGPSSPSCAVLGGATPFKAVLPDIVEALATIPGSKGSHRSAYGIWKPKSDIGAPGARMVRERHEKGKSG